VAYNFSDQLAHIVLPENMPGKRWFRIADTGAWMEEQGNFEDGKTMLDRYYSLHERSVLILAEK
jgi:isoamylase